MAILTLCSTAVVAHTSFKVHPFENSLMDVRGKKQTISDQSVSKKAIVLEPIWAPRTDPCLDVVEVNPVFVFCLQAWVSSPSFSAWFAPTAAAATPLTLRAHATNSSTWKWTDKQFPPQTLTATRTGNNATHTTRPPSPETSGTPSCSRATGIGSKK